MDAASKIWIIRRNPDHHRSFDQKTYDSQKWLALVEQFREYQPLLDHWETAELMLYPGSTPREVKAENKKPIPDFTKGVVETCISQRAKAILEPLIASQVEFLPLITPVGPYYELNIQRVDGLDAPHSTLEIIPETGEIFDVLSYAFRWDQLEGKHIFMLPELGPSVTFVSDTFKQTAEANGLIGLKFIPAPLA